MQCKQCNVQYEDKVGKLFCSRNCKSKWKYHNNTEYRTRKINRILINRKSKTKLLSRLTPEDIIKVKLLRGETH